MNVNTNSSDSHREPSSGEGEFGDGTGTARNMTAVESANTGGVSLGSGMPVSFQSVDRSTTWHMSQEDVNRITQAHCFNSFALQVDGSCNPVTWIHQGAETLIEIDLSGEYGAFVSMETDFPDSYIPKGISMYPIVIGSCFIWTGSNLVLDKHSTCASNSVKMTNRTTSALTFGLSKKIPKTGKQQLICLDLVLPAQPVVYTPTISTIYVKVGRNYKAGSVIADIGSWTRLYLAEAHTSFKYDTNDNVWSGSA